MSNKIKIPNRYNPDVFIPYTMENTINIALNLFQSVDEDLYNRAKDIVLGKSREEFRIYYLEDVKDAKEFDEKKKMGFLNIQGMVLYIQIKKRQLYLFH